MRKTKAESAKTREALLQAALEVFYRNGVAAASLQEIAQHAGVTRGALYWHFKNKEDLFDALFQEQFNKIHNQLTADIGARSPDTWQNLMTTVIKDFESLPTNHDHRKFLHILHLNCDHTEQNASIVKLLQKYRNMWYEQLRETFLLCIQQNTLPENLNLQAAVLYFQALIMGLTELWLTDPDSFDIRQIAPLFIETAQSLLQTCPRFRLPESASAD